jgi:pyruvate dehydrogenase E1 component alpha subunit
MSMGGEAIAVGVVSALPEGKFCGTYRSHALYLAATDDLDGFFGEMYGKSHGCVGGRGGSMHLFYPERVICTTAIVATNIPVAIGAAFACVYQGNSGKVAVFFGDGAVDEGAFWESLNVACLMRLPVVFVYEDNGYAVHSPAVSRHGYACIRDIVKNYNCSVYHDDSNDVESIHGKVLDASQKQLPAFVHVEYYRYLEHVGVNDDFDAGYRSISSMQPWIKKDPIAIQKERMLTLMSKEDIEIIELEVKNRVLKSLLRAKNGCNPDAPGGGRGSVLAGVFHA